MYQPSDYLDIPQDDEKVWRYLDFAKFLSLLDKQAIFFVSLEKLAEADKFEGLYPNFDAQNFQFINNFQQTIADAREFTKNYRRHFFVNCWHLNNIESDAMWKIYLNNEQGVAIQTSFNKLKNSFSNCKEYIMIGKVIYDDNPRITTRVLTCFYKRRSFEFEKELRVGFEKVPTDKDNQPNVTLLPQKNGDYIPVDVATLIEQVIVSPTASSWFYELVKSIVSKYDLPKSIVKKSALAEQPQ